MHKRPEDATLLDVLFGASHAPPRDRGWPRRARPCPGLSFVRGLDARGLDAPLLTAQVTGVQFDVPVTF